MSIGCISKLSWRMLLSWCWHAMLWRADCWPSNAVRFYSRHIQAITKYYRFSPVLYFAWHRVPSELEKSALSMFIVDESTRETCGQHSVTGNIEYGKGLKSESLKGYFCCMLCLFASCIYSKIRVGSCIYLCKIIQIMLLTNKCFMLLLK